jgi:8-oxo-dGTP diphosphatase
MVPERYNIRVYGLCIDNLGRILVTDERRGGYLMTKFPGGGHEFGEGLDDALRREFQEETETEIDVLGLFYVNDFLQISAFNPKDQLISIYYLVKLKSPFNAEIATKLHDFAEETGDAQAFRWIKLELLDAKDFTFPIDKVVVEKIKANDCYLRGLAHQSDFTA